MFVAFVFDYVVAEFSSVSANFSALDGDLFIAKACDNIASIFSMFFADHKHNGMSTSTSPLASSRHPLTSLHWCSCVPHLLLGGRRCFIL